jgi:hypothetical protein
VTGPDDVYMERKGRIARVADRLFEGEEAVLHTIERIVPPLGLRVTQRHLGWTSDFRMAPAVPADDNPADGLGQEWAKQHTEMTGNRRYLPGLFPQVRFNPGPQTRTLLPPSQGGDTGSNPVGTTSKGPGQKACRV